MTTISGSPVTSNLYSTVAVLKVRLGIADTTDDTTLGLILTGICRAIDDYCGQRFYRDTADTTRYFTAASKTTCFIDPLVSLTTLATDDYTNRDYTTTWLASDYDLLPYNAAAHNEPYTWIEKLPLSTKTFPSVRGAVKITGVFGWPAVPAAVSEAALLWSERLYKRKDAPFGVLAFPEAGELRLLKEIDPDVKTLLNPFVRYV